MRLTRRTILAGVGVAVPLPAMAADEPVTYPFAVAGGMPWAAVQLNGRNPPLPFLIDTGAGGFAVLRSTAEALKLSYYGKTSIQSAVGRTQAHFFGASVTLGGVVREPFVPLAGIDVLPGQMQGLIPLARFRVMGMDFDRGEVSISSQMVRDPDGYHALDLDAGRGVSGSLDRMGAYTNDDNNQMIKDHRPVIDAELNGDHVKLMVDTGSTEGVFLYPDYVKRKNLWDQFPRHIDAKVQTLAGQATARMVRAERLKVGRFVFANPPLTLGNPTDSGRDGVRTEAGLIGMEYVRRLNFISDPQHRKLWIRSNGSTADGYRYNRAGLEIAEVGEVPQVVALAPGSPAERAGLKLGDRLKGWRGGDAAAGLAWSLMGAPGSNIELQVERGGQVLALTVVLEERI
jgi:predicted aspartyl protease